MLTLRVYWKLLHFSNAQQNKLASLKATLVWNYNRPTHRPINRVTGIVYIQIPCLGTFLSLSNALSSICDYLFVRYFDTFWGPTVRGSTVQGPDCPGPDYPHRKNGQLGPWTTGPRRVGPLDNLLYPKGPMKELCWNQQARKLQATLEGRTPKLWLTHLLTRSRG